MIGFIVLITAACGGRTVRYACVAPDQVGDQMCTPPGGMPFCCPDNEACGTGPIESGGNGCPLDGCCPSPVADGGVE